MHWDCFPGLDFVAAKGPLFTNVGGTHTKGIPYTVDPSGDSERLRGKVLLIYDVPDMEEGTVPKLPGMGHIRIPQYPGYCCDLQGKNSVREYIDLHLSKRAHARLRNYQNRLEREQRIRFTMVRGDIPEDAYGRLFDRFHALLTKRFEDKQTVNNNLDPEEWRFYKEVSLPMMRKGEAGLFIAYDGDVPVAMALLNFSQDRVFDVIRVFDIDYARYRLGTISLVQQLEWCIRNNFKVLDFSKGHYEYKRQWSTQAYMFHYHLWYDSKSLRSTLLARALALKFHLKFRARKYNLQESVHKIRYKLRPKA